MFLGSFMNFGNNISQYTRYWQRTRLGMREAGPRRQRLGLRGSQYFAEQRVSVRKGLHGEAPRQRAAVLFGEVRHQHLLEALELAHL